MPITAWQCPSCCRPVPLDHFATTECGHHVHPDYANAVLLREREYHEGAHGVRVHDGLGCPRKHAIERTESYAADPLSYNAVERGNAWHDFMQKYSADPQMAEVEVVGVIAGVNVGGRIDRLRGVIVEGRIVSAIVEDWKTSSDFREKYVKKDGISPEYQVQGSLYAELVEQSFRWRPTWGRIWYKFSRSILPLEYDLWPLDQALAHHPHGGEYSVVELLRQAELFVTGMWDWKQLPLAGETQRFGDKTLCDYCSVRAVCWTQAKGAPF